MELVANVGPSSDAKPVSDQSRGNNLTSSNADGCRRTSRHEALRVNSGQGALVGDILLPLDWPQGRRLVNANQRNDLE